VLNVLVRLLSILEQQIYREVRRDKLPFITLKETRGRNLNKGSVFVPKRLKKSLIAVENEFQPRQQKKAKERIRPFRCEPPDLKRVGLIEVTPLSVFVLHRADF
jgi:hypothetical protein